MPLKYPCITFPYQSSIFSVLQGTLITVLKTIVLFITGLLQAVVIKFILQVQT